MFGFLSHLKSDVYANAGPELIESVLNHVSAMLRKHFTHEEAIMARCGLPDDLYSAHVEAHRVIIEELIEVHLAGMQNQYPPLQKLLEMVIRWIATHLVDFDLALKPFLEQPSESSVIQSNASASLG